MTFTMSVNDQSADVRPVAIAAETTVLDWSKRLVGSVYGSHDTDIVVTGTQRR
jgi:hypothetical protein